MGEGIAEGLKELELVYWVNLFRAIITYLNDAITILKYTKVLLSS